MPGSALTTANVMDDHPVVQPPTDAALDPDDNEARHIASTAVLPEARGGGIGVALTTHALALAAEHGHPRVWTNWRVTNLGASRFWPARGFRLVRLRLPEL